MTDLPPPIADRYKTRPKEREDVEANWAAWERLKEGSPRSLPHRATNDDIARGLERFDRAQELIREGRIEEARQIIWWPRNEDPPKKHPLREPIRPCSCGQNSPDGVYGLCGYCKGTTHATPSLIPRGSS